MFLYCTNGHLSVEVQTQINTSYIGSVFLIFLCYVVQLLCIGVHIQ
jgi:hypothetical protein